MSWATKHIEKLQQNETVKFRPVGKSMTGLIESGQLCTVTPIIDKLKINDIVLCKVSGSQYLHLIKDIKNNEYQIGNNRGGINGWITIDYIFGKCVKVEP